MSTITRAGRPHRASTSQAQPAPTDSSNDGYTFPAVHYLASLSTADWSKLSTAVSLARVLIEYEMRECEQVFADKPNEKTILYWRGCLQEAIEAGEIVTRIRANPERRFT